MNTIDNEKNYWEGVPERLILMCLASRREGSHSYIRFILDYLKEHMSKGSFLNAIEPYEAIHFSSRAIEYTLFPLEFHFEEDWLEYADDISHVLDRYEELLKLAEGNCQEWIPIDEHKHKWNIYKAVSLMASENWDDLEEQLERVLEDTKGNVKDMLASEEPERYALTDDGDGQYHYPELLIDSIQTINWLAKESLPYGKSRRLLTLTYEKYCLFLEDLEPGSTHPGVVNYLRKRAEEYLQHLCWPVLDEIDDQLELSECDKKELVADKAIYDSILQKSSERYSRVVKEADAFSKYIEEAERKDARSYHKKYGALSRRLRTIMNENPTLPIVILSQPGMGELECSVAYVYDNRTEQFKEKIIAIYNSSDRISEIDPDIYFDLPFC